MQLPYGAVKDNFEKCKKIVAKLTNDNKNLDEATLKIMDIVYSTGGSYSDESLLIYANTYLKLKNTNSMFCGDKSNYK